MPRQIPYPVTVSFGKPLSVTAKADAVRQVVLELGSQACAHRVTGLRPLHQHFFRHARRLWGTEAVVDTRGARLSFGRLATAAILIDQDDTDMPLIKIEATETANSPGTETATLTTYEPASTVVGPSYNSGTSTGWVFAGMVLIDVNGSPRYMPTYTYTEP